MQLNRILLQTYPSKCRSMMASSTSPVQMQLLRRLSVLSSPLPRLSPVTTLSRSLHTSRSLFDSQPTTRETDTSLQRPVPAQRTGHSDRLSFWPFLIIFLGGTGLFVLTVRQREGVHPKPKSESTQPLGAYPGIKNRKPRDYAEEK